MIRQVYLPVTMKVDEVARSFAQHDPRLREVLNKDREDFLESIKKAEDELDDLLKKEFTILSATVFVERNGRFVHYVLWKSPVGRALVTGNPRHIRVDDVQFTAVGLPNAYFEEKS